MKLNQYTKVILGLIVLFITQASCSKILDLNPTDQIDEKDIFKSVESLERAVLGVYANWDLEYSLRIASVMSDECRLGLNNAGVSAAGQNLFRWNYSSEDNEIVEPWKNGYQVIDRVNRLLAGISHVPSNKEADKEKLDLLQGELLAIRAYQHFDLYRIYAASGTYNAQALAVPYVKKSNTNSQPSRPNTESFFSDFWHDMKEAETLLAGKDALANSRMGLLATYALHARAALYTLNYPEAEHYATAVIQKIPLASGQTFEKIWEDESNTELIFKLKRTNVSEIRPGDLFYNIGAERILFAPSLQLMSLYDEADDVRFNSYFEENPNLADEGELTERIIKYQGSDSAPNRTDVKVFRTSEMYLIRAEAALQKNDQNSAENDINTLRRARIQNYNNETFDNEEEVKVAIETERYKELAFEGHRYFDLKRWGKAINRSNLDVEPRYMFLSTNDKAYLIPIPQGEVLANPNIRPNNPGW